VVVVDPQSIPTNQLVPPVTIESFLVDGHERATEQALELEAGRQRFEFGFTSLSLLAPEKVRFKFRLEGLEDEWTEPTERRRAYYNSLRPGRYTFRVQACNNDGVWNEEGDSLNFRLRPFFYQTRSFYAVCVVFAFGLGAGLVMLRVRQLQHREKVLAELVTQRTHELAAANEELERLANVDGLTGIANHRFLDGFLAMEWRRCRRDRAPLSLVMLDVDYFKRYNDRYGHQAGDECLKALAQVFADSTRRASDLAARYGGEEFILVLSETPDDGAMHVAESVRRRVEGLAIPHLDGGPEGVVTVSAGVVTVVPGDGLQHTDVLGVADQALYDAKRGGRNRVVKASVSPA
jgi:diguanylate cyclase (GGDEF)-like protein